MRSEMCPKMVQLVAMYMYITQYYISYFLTTWFFAGACLVYFVSLFVSLFAEDLECVDWLCTAAQGWFLPGKRERDVGGFGMVFSVLHFSHHRLWCSNVMLWEGDVMLLSHRDFFPYGRQEAFIKGEQPCYSVFIPSTTHGVLKAFTVKVDLKHICFNPAHSVCWMAKLCFENTMGKLTLSPPFIALCRAFPSLFGLLCEFREHELGCRNSGTTCQIT